MPTTYVYIYLEEGPVPAGLLETIGVGREANGPLRLWPSLSSAQGPAGNPFHLLKFARYSSENQLKLPIVL